jgi:hypothetical protein
MTQTYCIYFNIVYACCIETLLSKHIYRIYENGLLLGQIYHIDYAVYEHSGVAIYTQLVVSWHIAVDYVTYPVYNQTPVMPISKRWTLILLIAVCISYLRKCAMWKQQYTYRYRLFYCVIYIFLWHNLSRAGACIAVYKFRYWALMLPLYREYTIVLMRTRSRVLVNVEATYRNGQCFCCFCC